MPFLTQSGIAESEDSMGSKGQVGPSNSEGATGGQARAPGGNVEEELNEMADVLLLLHEGG